MDKIKETPYNRIFRCDIDVCRVYCVVAHKYTEYLPVRVDLCTYVPLLPFSVFDTIKYELGSNSALGLAQSESHTLDL